MEGSYDVRTKERKEPFDFQYLPQNNFSRERV